MQLVGFLTVLLVFCLSPLSVSTQEDDTTAADLTKFELKSSVIQKTIVNRNNSNVYIATNSSILILDKNLKLIRSTESAVTNCTSASTGALQQEFYVFELNYNTNTLVECAKRADKITCRVRNMQDLNCIDDADETNQIARVNFKKALSLSAKQNNLINDKGYMYMMPSILDPENLYTTGSFEDDYKLFYIFNLNPRELYQSVVLINNAIGIDKEHFRANKQLIDVVYQFKHDSYIYYLYVLNSPLAASSSSTTVKSSRRYAKLLRFCDFANGKISALRASEIQLQCKVNSVLYDDVVDAYSLGNSLFVIFKSDGLKNALCTYDINELNQYYTKNINDCFQPNSSTNVETCKKDFKRGNDQDCACDSLAIILPQLNTMSYCSYSSIGIDANSMEYVNIRQALYFSELTTGFLRPDENVIKVLSSYSIHDIQLLFLITDKNNLYAYKLITTTSSNNRNSQILSRFLVINLNAQLDSGSSEERIIRNLEYNERESLLYLTFKSKLLRLNLNNCSSYNTCSKCSNSNSPFCGWCLFDNRCSTQSECRSDIWQFDQTDDSACPAINSIEYNGKRYLPGSQIYVSPQLSSNLVKLNVSFKVKSTYRLICMLVDMSSNKLVQQVNSTIDVMQNLVLCEFNQKFNLSELSADLSMSVYLKANETREVISMSQNSTFNLIFINCQNRVTCSTCLNENLCNWDMSVLRCVPRSTGRSSDLRVIGDKARCLKYNLVNFQPNVAYNQQNSTKLKPMQFEIVNLNANFFDLYTLTCKFNRTHQLPARLTSQSSPVASFECLYVPSSDRQLNEKSPEQFVFVNVVAVSRTDSSRQVYIDDLNINKVNIVNCEQYALNCGNCLQDYLLNIDCGWCTSQSKCTTRDACTAEWLARLDTGDYAECPSPSILDLQPQCGPLRGGTQLTIHGVNLGHSPSEINTYLFSENKLLRCDLNPELYIKSSRITCALEKLDYGRIKENSAYYVLININTARYSRNITTSKNGIGNGADIKFKFISPLIYSIEPTKTILSGGTRIKITGKNLNCGSVRSVYFGDKKCEIVENESQSGNEIFCVTSEMDRNRNHSLKLMFSMDEYQAENDQISIEYVNDPVVTSISRNRTILSGGIGFTINGQGFDTIQNSEFTIKSAANSMQTYKSKCKRVNDNRIDCVTPRINDTLKQWAKSYQLNVVLDGMNYFNKFNNYLSIDVYDDPVVKETQMTKVSEDDYKIFIQGDNFQNGLMEADYNIMIGDNRGCISMTMTNSLITCTLSIANTSELAMDNKVSVRFIKSSELFEGEGRTTSSLTLASTKTVPFRIVIGKNYNNLIGFLNYETIKAPSGVTVEELMPAKYIIMIAGVICSFLVILMVSLLVTFKVRQKKQTKQLRLMQTEFENLESRVANECKEAFAELQMDIGELANTLNQCGPPFNDFQTYTMKILFPNASETEKYLMTANVSPRADMTHKQNVRNGLELFKNLLNNKEFLLTFIHTLEPTFTLEDRVKFASYISICLYDNLPYFTDILTTLLSEVIEKLIESKVNARILFRRNESVAEKMLTNWFAFLLYDFIKDCAGTPLYILFLSIKQQIYKGPVDAITCEARYSLNQQNLIRQKIDYETMTIRVQLQDLGENTHEISVKVLNIDTISQVKDKILDSFYKGYQFTKRPHADDLDLAYITNDWNQHVTNRINYQLNPNSRIILLDEDKTSKHDSEYKRLNTLAHYKVPNGALLLMYNKQMFNFNSHNNNDSYTLLDAMHNKNYAENMTLLSKSSKESYSPPSYSKSSTTVMLNDVQTNLTNVSISGLDNLTPTNNSSSNNIIQMRQHSKVNRFHLVKPTDSNLAHSSKDEKTTKLASEVYLTRLLATKGGVQSYIDDFFETLFSTTHGSSVLPYAIKYLFDFLDDQANYHTINDTEVVYTWKSNSLPLRFWVNIIKNPEFVFDIHKSHIVDASLSVIASTFIDSCSQSHLDLNKESPSGKLLFFKEIHKYRKWVESYYSEIKRMKRIHQEDMNAMLNDESMKHQNEFNINYALYKLFNDYVKKYLSQIKTALNRDSHSQQLDYRLQQVVYLIEAIEV